MNLPASDPSIRLRELERQALSLQDQIRRMQRDIDRRVDPSPVRLAVTCKAADNSYPASTGFPASVYPIKFLDVAFNQAAGAEDLSESNRSADVQAHAYSLTDRYLPEGTPVVVVWRGRRWTILSAETVALIGYGAGEDGITSPTLTTLTTPLPMASGFVNDAAENYFAWDAANSRLEVQQHGAGIWRLELWNQFIYVPDDPLAISVSPAVYDSDVTIDFLRPLSQFVVSAAIVATTSAASTWGPSWSAATNFIPGIYTPLHRRGNYIFEAGDWISFACQHTAGPTITAEVTGANILAIRSTYNNWLPI